MEKDMKNDQASTTILPSMTIGTRPVHAPDVPPLRRVTMNDVQKVESLLRARRSAP